MAELSDFNQIRSRLQKTLDEELKNIRDLKQKCVKDQTFEMVAAVRDMEKILLALREGLHS